MARGWRWPVPTSSTPTPSIRTRASSFPRSRAACNEACRPRPRMARCPGGVGGPCLRAVRRHQVSEGLRAFRVGESGRAEGRRSLARAAAAHHQPRQAEPVHAQGHFTPGMAGLIFEPLLTGTLDEPTTAYGLLAEDVEVAPDKLSVTFRLNPAARFHNGKPVMAEDVKYTFDRLMSKEASPQYRVVYGDVKRVLVVGPRPVRFDLARASAELPLLVGGLPVFSREWGAGKPFDLVINDPPIGSGPYRIARWNSNDVTYERDPNYWARDLGVRRGMYNFERVTYKIYKDNTAQTEAFKAGEFDYIRTFSAREWARVYVGKKFDSGELVRAELPSKNAGDFQSYWINIRREKFKDVRVRQAIALAFDFEWMNRRLMYESYVRCTSWFNGSDFEAEGLPGPDELKVLEPLRKKLPAQIFTEEVPQPPNPNPPGSLRDNLRKARELLAAAGWTYRDGALRNARGEPFVLEYLDSGSGNE